MQGDRQSTKSFLINNLRCKDHPKEVEKKVFTPWFCKDYREP
jgi:hypothetical protein